MDFQILLLPRKKYWSWVRASMEYVQAYGANLTSEPETAANYMAPQQVITFPHYDQAFPDLGDIERWLEQRQPGVRLDPIEAETPQAFKQALGERIEKKDRFGQRQRPFFLLWPTNYPVITQKFGVNPQIYTRFGMPGHEGLDIRALTNTDVYACADGEVYEVHTNPRDHAYGIHVRIQHAFGYKTVYGHLAAPLVRVGEHVVAGQVIGKADSTGASTAAHLHLTLKQTGATARRETRYPQDVIDPTPFMVWPESNRLPKTISPAAWAAGRCLSGLHARIDAPMNSQDLDDIKTAKVEAVKILCSESDEMLTMLRSALPEALLVCRLSADFSGPSVTPGAFLAEIGRDAERLYGKGVQYFELLAQPNLQLEGWQRSWGDGLEFAAWFEEVFQALKSRLPEAQMGFPGLAPGDDLLGWRQDAMRFLEQAEPAVQLADWVGVNCYWTDEAGMQAPAGGRHFEIYRHHYPDKLLMITEFAFSVVGDADQDRAGVYHEYYRMVQAEVGIAAAFAFALSANHGYQPLVWHRQGERDSSLVQEIGRLWKNRLALPTTSGGESR
jgi:hypothetical protein